MEKQTPLKSRVVERQYLDDETSEAVSYSITEKQEVSFYLGPFGKYFTPCEEDQEKLNYILEKADALDVLYSTSTIKLQREFVTLDETEKETERRPPTEEDFKKHFSSSHWESAWKHYQESLK